MQLMIHCTRQQVALLAVALPMSKLHLEKDGTKSLIFPEWYKRMYQAAKLYEYTIAYGRIDDKARPKMRSYHSHPQVIKEHKR